MSRMSHDITHCAGNGCPIKNTCFRFEAHLDLQARRLPGHFSYYVPDYLCDKAKKRLGEIRNVIG